MRSLHIPSGIRKICLLSHARGDEEKTNFGTDLSKKEYSVCWDALRGIRSANVD